MNKRCYWCGGPAISEDHVPARCFYPTDSRKNLIKVPACKQHNTDLSKLDERFRYYIQAASQSPIAIKEFGDTTVRGILRPQAEGFRRDVFSRMVPARLNGNQTAAQKVDGMLFRQFFEKIARGLYFYHRGECFDGSISFECTHISVSGRDIRPAIQAFGEMSHLLTQGQITDSRVFDYKYGLVTEGPDNAFAVIGTFYGDVTFFTIGTGKSRSLKDS